MDKQSVWQSKEMGAKSRRNEKGYDLEKSRIGAREGKITRTVQHPVTPREGDGKS